MLVAILRPINLTVLGYVEHIEPSPIWKHALGDYDESFRCDNIPYQWTITFKSQNMISFQIFHDKKCNHKTATSNSYRAKVELARNTKESNFQVSLTVEDQLDFENVIPENVTGAGKRI